MNKQKLIRALTEIADDVSPSAIRSFIDVLEVESQHEMDDLADSLREEFNKKLAELRYAFEELIDEQA